MAAMPTRTRHRVGVGCDACGTRTLVHFTLHHHGRNEDGALLIAIELDAVDRVMVELFTAAHHGPFTRQGVARAHHTDCPHPDLDAPEVCPCRGRT